MLDLDGWFELRRKHNDNGTAVSQEVINTCLDSRFNGIADEIKPDGFGIIFVFGGYEYKLTTFNVYCDPISDVYAAVVRARDYYTSRKDKK